MRFGTRRSRAKIARIEEQEVLLPLELAAAPFRFRKGLQKKLAQINICRGFKKTRYFTFRGKFVILYLELF